MFRPPVHPSPGEKDPGSISQCRLNGKRGLCPSATRRGGGRYLHVYTSNQISGRVRTPSSWARKMGPEVPACIATLRARGDLTTILYPHRLQKHCALQDQARLTANLQLAPCVPWERGPLSCKSACPQSNRWTGTARRQDVSIKG